MVEVDNTPRRRLPSSRAFPQQLGRQGKERMRTRYLTFVLPALAAALLAVAGCGGASDETGGGAASASSGSSGSSGGGGKLSLVAYSTPQGVYDEVIPMFGKSAAGKGTSFSESF